MADFEFNSQNVTQLITAVTKAGIDKADAVSLVGNYLVDLAGQGRRVFAFQTAFEQADAHCRAAFQRTFQHTDWQDGESVVQAEETPTEEGFNRRFHHIEADLDAVRADLLTMMECVNQMRSSLYSMFGEVRTELNRLNADVFRLSNTRSTQTGPIISQAPNQFVGTTKWFDQNMNVFQTDKGMMLFPLITEVKTNPAPNDLGGKLNYIGQVSEFVLTEDRVKQKFDAGPVKKEDLVRDLGQIVTPTGDKFATVLETLPANAVFKNAEELMSGIADVQAKAILADPGASRAITEAAGGAASDKLAETPINKAVFLDADQRTAMDAAGIKNVGALETKSLTEVSKTLSDAGASVSTGSLASAKGKAALLTRLQR